jgi:hypothetical protein
VTSPTSLQRQPVCGNTVLPTFLRKIEAQIAP